MNRTTAALLAAVTIAGLSTTSASAYNQPDRKTDNTVTSRTVVNGSLFAQDLAPTVVKWFTTGQVTGAGTNTSETVWPGDHGATLHRTWVVCGYKQLAVGGGFTGAKGVRITTSTPARFVPVSPTTWEPVAAESGFTPNGWLVEGYNAGGDDITVKPAVVCLGIS